MTEETPAPTTQPGATEQRSTPTERYLQQICARNFLSLWSYAHPYRDQGGGKEICDLVVVMGDDVIVFSDKHCELTPKKGLDVDWSRWFRAAVAEAARQAWGAERWLRKHPDRVFVDRECTRPLPLQLPPPEGARYHLVVTVHGVAAASRAMLGGSGSLILHSGVRGLDQHKDPFVIGDLDPDRSFVHVFDDATLDFVMSALDTTPDFVRYLRQKEQFLRSRDVIAAGEENLLAFYLTNVDDTKQHVFAVEPAADFVAIDDTPWPHFRQSPEYRARRQHDEISYLWDELIEGFARPAVAGTQYHATEPAFESTEKVLRFMAGEPRLRRRYLAEAISEILRETPADRRRLRVVATPDAVEPVYVFLLLPWRHDRSEADNRTGRYRYLEACMRVTKFKFRGAQDIIGIATESGLKNGGRSEDALYLDARLWTEEDYREAQTLMEELEILRDPKITTGHVDEYPADPHEDVQGMEIPKNPRNKPCPCGSRIKFKRCHGR